MEDWLDSYAVGWAAGFGHVKALKELLLLGANPNLENASQSRAVDEARREGFTEIVDLLERF